MKIKSKYYISLEQFEEVFTNLKKLKETKYKENDGIIIKFDQNSNSLLQYTPTGLHVWFHYGRHTYHAEVYDFSESLFNKNNIKKLYNKYSKMLLGLNKAHYENTPLKIDFTDTSVNLGVTCVAFLGYKEKWYVPLQRAKFVQQMFDDNLSKKQISKYIQRIESIIQETKDIII